MTFLISGNDVISMESRPLNFRVFIHAYSLRPQTLFPVVANTHTKSIQKQTKSIDADKVGRKKLQQVNRISCRINGLLISRSNSKQARLQGAVRAFLFRYTTVDECNTDQFKSCHEKALCHNTQGSFTCSFKPGYGKVRWIQQSFLPIRRPIEFIRFKDYYGMPRGHEHDPIYQLSIYARFSKFLVAVSREALCLAFMSQKHTHNVTDGSNAPSPVAGD